AENEAEAGSQRQLVVIAAMLDEQVQVGLAIDIEADRQKARLALGGVAQAIIHQTPRTRQHAVQRVVADPNRSGFEKEIADSRTLDEIRSVDPVIAGRLKIEAAHGCFV